MRSDVEQVTIQGFLRINADDHPWLSQWYEAHDFSAPPLGILPPYGIISVDESDTPMAAGFLYKSDGGIAWLEWLVSNPEVKPLAAAKHLKRVIGHMKSQAVLYGYNVVFTSMHHRGLIKLMQRCGFVVGDKGMTNLIWEVVISLNIFCFSLLSKSCEKRSRNTRRAAPNWLLLIKARVAPFPNPFFASFNSFSC